MVTQALIGLGSNLGDRKTLLDGAVAALARTDGVIVRAVSRYHETAPVGGPANQGVFLNAAATLETDLSAEMLHDRMIGIECEAGRTREVRWGERTLDLDLLLYGDEIHDSPRLTVPHLRMAVRRFVLAPAAEIAPDMLDPLTGRTIADLLANLDRRPGYVALSASAAGALFPRLIDSLDAFGMDDGATEFAHWCYEFDPDFYRKASRIEFEQKARELNPSRWKSETWGSGWLVTNYWIGDTLEALFHRHGGLRERSDIDAAGIAPDAWMSPLVEPTFVVTAYDTAEADLRLPVPRTRIPESRPPLRSPILRIRGLNDPRKAMRAIAAQVRGGELLDRANDLTESAPRILAENIAPMLAEVVAACHASRAGAGSI